MSRKTISTITATAIFLSGCATAGLDKVSYDTCKKEREALNTSESYFARSIAHGAFIGALAGAGIGALFGASQKKDVGKSALIGAGAGAFAGGFGGYFNARQKQAKDASELADLIEQDVNKDASEIDRATIAFVQLKNCRIASANQIKADFKAKKISKEEAETKLNELQTLFKQEISAAKKLGVNLKKRADEYSLAADGLLADKEDGKKVFAEWKEKSTQKTVKADKIESFDNLNEKDKKAVEVAIATETNVSKRVTEYESAIASAEKTATDGTFSLKTDEARILGIDNAVCPA